MSKYELDITSQCDGPLAIWHGKVIELATGPGVEWGNFCKSEKRPPFP